MDSMNADSWPLNRNPPPFPFTNQQNYNAINPNSTPVNRISAPPMMNQYQQPSGQHLHQLPNQSFYYPQWPPIYQNLPIYPFYQQQPNLTHNVPVQQPSAPVQYQTNPQGPPSRFEKYYRLRQHLLRSCLNLQEKILIATEPIIQVLNITMRVRKWTITSSQLGGGTGGEQFEGTCE